MNWLRVKNLIKMFNFAAGGVLLSIFVHCSPGESNGSGVGNGMISGTFYAPDGQSPAEGAIVRVWKKNTLAGIVGGGQAKTNAAQYITEVDKNGAYAFDTIDTGLYVVEGVDAEGNMALIDSVLIKTSDARLELPSDTLKVPGTVRGSVVLEAGGNPKRVFILCFGNDRYVQTGADGTFSMGTLAEGVYRLKLVSLDEQYGSVDTGAICIGSGDTTELGAIVLPLTTLPEATDLLVVNYDTMTQVVKLSWHAATASLTKGYNLYRRSSDSAGFGIQLNGSFLVHDTTWYDSTAHQDSTYEYRLAAVDANDNEGSLSNSANTTIRPARLVVDSFQLADFDSSGVFRLINGKKPDFYYFQHQAGNAQDGYVDTSVIDKYTRAGMPMRRWVLPCSLICGDVAIDSVDNLYYSHSTVDKNQFWRVAADNGEKKMLLEKARAYFPFDVVDGGLVYFSETAVDTFVIVNKYTLSEDSALVEYHIPRSGGWSCDIHGNMHGFYYQFGCDEGCFGVPWSETCEIVTFNPLGIETARFAKIFYEGFFYRHFDSPVSGFCPVADSMYFIPLVDKVESANNDLFSLKFLVYGAGGNLRLRLTYPHVLATYMAGDGTIVFLDANGSIRRLRYR